MRKYISYILILVIFLSYFDLRNVVSADKLDFGDYTDVIESLTICKGAKSSNITDNYVQFVRNTTTGRSYMYGNTSAKREAGPVMGRVRFFKWSDNRYEALVTFNSDNLCAYKELKKMVFDKFFKLDAKCTLRKGITILDGTDLADMGKWMMGERFFFGKYKVQMTFFVAKANLLCFEIVQHVVDNSILKKYLKNLYPNGDAS